MKTLDEVIGAFEWCMHDDDADCSQCPYYTGKDTDCHNRNVDTLYYLKKLKRIEAKIEKIAIGNIEDTLSKLDNPALTWDELRQMEGKPIWVEVDYHNPEETYKYWTIVKYFDSDEGGDMVFTGTGFYHKDLLGIDWRAYRKEKNETD